jgi:hypothetical protein
LRGRSIPSICKWLFSIGPKVGESELLVLVYYDTQILSQLTIWYRIKIGQTNPKLIISVHITHFHTTKIILDFRLVNTMGKISNHTYSPNWSPCDFYAFGYVNESLIRKKFTNREEVLESINHTLKDIKQMTLEQGLMTILKY